MYKSQAQMRWAHTKTGMKALGGKAKVSEWDTATEGMSLPVRTRSKFKSKIRHQKIHHG